MNLNSVNTSLTVEMNPAEDPPSHGAPSSRIPEGIKTLLISELEKGAGKDWEHFVTALGLGMEAKDMVRIRQGHGSTKIN